jgi:lipopolysaccharide export system permease protein
MRYRVIRSLLSQLYAYVLMGSGIFISVLLVLQLLRLSEFLIVYSVSFWDLSKLLFFMSISFLPIVIPTSMVFATFSVMGRFVEKREWLGMLTCGIGYRHLCLAMSLYFALPLSVFCLYLGLDVVPWGSRQVDKTAEAIYNKKSLTSVQQNVFFNLFDEMVMYVGDMDTDKNQMQNIFLYDERDPNVPVTITAQEGEMERNVTDGTIDLNFKRGIVQSHDQSESSLRTMTYKKLKVSAEIAHRSKAIFPLASSLNVTELNNRIRELESEESTPHIYYEFLVDLHRRFALPVAGFVFVLLGFAISLSSQKRYFKLSPMVQSLVVLLVYWSAYIVNNLLTFKGILPAWVGLWATVVLFFIISAQQLYAKRVMY